MLSIHYKNETKQKTTNQITVEKYLNKTKTVNFYLFLEIIF